MFWLLLLACIDDDKLADKLDQDGDGFNATGSSGDDCDDHNPSINPGEVEQCDGVDNDCDGLVDNNPSDGSSWYIDNDGDGVGETSQQACSQPLNGVVVGGDCDDIDPDRFPGRDELCNQVDDDCDGTIDEGLETSIWYVDADNDGHGNPKLSKSLCGVLDSYSPFGDDCDDTNAEINPSATETFYDGVDQNCSGTSDHDADGDGEEAPSGGGTDCDDNNADVNSGEAEVCNNGIDDDCIDNDTVCQPKGAQKLALVATQTWFEPGYLVQGISPAPPLQLGATSFFTWGEGDWTRWQLETDLSNASVVAQSGLLSVSHVAWSEENSTSAMVQNHHDYCWLDLSSDIPTNLGCTENDTSNSGSSSYPGLGGTRLIRTEEDDVFRIDATMGGVLISELAPIATAPTGSWPRIMLEWQSGSQTTFVSSGGGYPQYELWTATGSNFDAWSPGPVLPASVSLENMFIEPSLTGDQDPDILVLTSSWPHLGVHLLSTPSSPTDLTTPWWNLTLGESGFSHTTMDFDGDGYLDLILWPGEGQPVSVVLGPFSPQSPPTVHASLDLPNQSYGVSVTSISTTAGLQLLAAVPNSAGTTFYVVPFGAQ